MRIWTVMGSEAAFEAELALSGGGLLSHAGHGGHC